MPVVFLLQPRIEHSLLILEALGILTKHGQEALCNALKGWALAVRTHVDCFEDIINHFNCRLKRQELWGQYREPRNGHYVRPNAQEDIRVRRAWIKGKIHVLNAIVGDEGTSHWFLA